jgi:CheY-like chemotaxis protein
MPSAAFKHLDLIVNIDADLPDDLLLDEHRLRQVLMNLLSNAVKFTNNGAVCLTLKSKPLSDNRAELYFSVADTGTGIEADKQKKIFEPFTQEDGSITREFGGTGLGLAISTQLVELMGGKIDINSTKGKGSDFFFTIYADVAVDVRPQKFVDSNTQITVITNEVDSSVKIQADLLHSDITNVSSLEYMLDLPNHLVANSVDSKVEQVIIYCQKTIKLTLKDIDFLNKLNLKHTFVLVQLHTDEKYDFDHRIDGLVTTPLLGNRLLKTIQSALVNKVESLSLKESTPGELQGQSKQLDVASDRAETNVDNNLILIVEDNLINQKVATLLLKQCGYDSHIANNGEEAVTKVTSGEFKYKAILMDCMMPIMDGFTATVHIREWEVSSSITATPIIALTASVLDADIQRCFDVGMDDYVPKPFKKDLLMDKIDRLANVA